MSYQIREMSEADWEQVRDIYIEGISAGNSTFETEAPSWEVWDVAHVKSCRLVVVGEGKVVGWAALSLVSSRCVYTGVAEVSIYLAQDYCGQGIGFRLLKELIGCSEDSGFWTLQSGIFPENVASLALHRKCGFRQVGLRKKQGKMNNGTWRDVVLVERRSEVVGND
ncbi:MAG TPA: N-acetyltransferase [Desulfosporosinus sp.]|nr:N-acetyltransferase [Desulfosporosinus sp.]